ncbi:hypothetical protein [Streptomyces alkaliterrae]|uniref:Transmembrane protein n=1 Tax=Streptomyces alkaliterrae TaxID=2213162 RepID=A0A5P0YN46_9ACTN|nr:hypothetical protein [Streptomyces alkaliterrae]MBB1259376.1 hypothetical protein [Streptomyces alkaliterrae]MQS01774.1 hypothetical protein [Streptomyces alkaliterrae]
MNEQVALHPEDRAAFENALQRALDAPDVRTALGQPEARHTVDGLRACARAAAESLAAEAAPEYAVLLEIRARAAVEIVEHQRAEDAKDAVAALAVLTPILAAAATVVFLVLGYGLRLAGAAGPLAKALVSVGWGAAAVTGVAGLASAAGLALTVRRHRVPASPPPPDAVAQAHADWLDALTERGLLPCLRRELRLPETGDATTRRAGPCA